MASSRRLVLAAVQQAANLFGMPRHHHHVYVVELSPDVIYEPRFRKANPEHVRGKPCVYVGMTGLNPDLRFDKHKAGIQSNRYVFEFGLRLLPALYAMYNPMPLRPGRRHLRR